jgi:hypothetical protein
VSFPFYFFSVFVDIAQRANTCKFCNEKHIAKGDTVLVFMVQGGSSRTRRVALSCANTVLDQYIEGFNDLKELVAKEITEQAQAEQLLLTQPVS